MTPEYELKRKELAKSMIRSRMAMRRGDKERAMYWLEGARLLREAMRKDEETARAFAERVG